MKALLTILLIAFLLPAFAQEDPATLAKQLTENQKTEIDKVKAIFNWITENISYKTKTLPKKIIGPASFKNYIDTDEDAPLQSVNQRVSENVLRKREAVCDGYARLFTTLCDYAGIHSVIIEGYAKAGIKSSARFSVNHYWNAVEIGSKWYLVDATWACGYITDDGYKFVRMYDPAYFMPSPKEFIRDHYPDDPRWTLLEDGNTPEEFRKSPFKQKSFTKYNFRAFSPSSGIIETFVGDTLHLQIETANGVNRDICPDLLMDSTIYTYSSNWVFLKPESGKKANQVSYHFNVTSQDLEWLYLVYNDDLVLRYKVNVR